MISAQELSPKARVFYIVINYEKGPLFGKFVTYQAKQGWILTSFIFNTKEELILPPALR